jgi:aldehyde:ferredoxin oxidoreductase
MTRSSWINDESTPDLDAHVAQLEHFTNSIADGVIDAKELSTQEANVVAAMKNVEGSLNDDQHAKVTRLLAEVAAYSVMRTLHELAQAKVQQAVGPKS